MEGHVVSSSSSGNQNNNKHKLNCNRWNDDLCSNIYYTKPWYRSEIRKLKAEITTLESSLKEEKQSFSTANLSDILSKLFDKISKDKRDLLEGLDLKGKLNEDGEVDVKRLERFTGLCISEIALKTEEEKNGICVRKHHVHGRCRGIEFQTTFLVEEIQNDGVLSDKEVSRNLPRVTNLEVDIEDKEAKLNMKDFLKYVQEEKQLQLFFVTLQSYSKWRKDRLKTFNHFQELYPELVTYTPLRDGTTMTICNQKHPNLRVNIVWKVFVSKQGAVVPFFDLHTCIPVEELGNDAFVRKMRSKFLRLLKNVGIEKSIELIILTMAK